MPYMTYAEVMRLGGLVGEEDYPYKGSYLCDLKYWGPPHPAN